MGSMVRGLEVLLPPIRASHAPSLPDRRVEFRPGSASLCVERDRASSPPPPPLLWASFLGLQPKWEHPVGRHVGPVRHQLELPVAPTPGDIAGPGAQLSQPYS